MSYTHFSVNYPRDGLAVVTLQPTGEAKLFQFNGEKLNELITLFDDLESQPELRSVIITGVGKVFAAGADIVKMRAIAEGGHQLDEGLALAEMGHLAMDRIENSRLFVIAAYNGSGVGGGCEIGLACDWRIAVENAKLGQPEINLGLIPGWGGTRRLQRLVGPARARLMIFTGDLLDANTALEWGLLQEVADNYETLMEMAIHAASKVLNKSALVLAKCKQAVVAGATLSDKEAQMLEQRLFGECFETNDTKEGLAAFLEKRPPKFH